jgi:hypothetical protein
MIWQEDFQQMLSTFKEMSFKITYNIISNPFDMDLNYFLEICRKRIPYLVNQPDNLLRQLFFSGEFKMYEVDEPIFKANERCKDLIIIMQGVVEIDMTDGLQNVLMDLLGKGSVIGVNSFFTGVPWVFNAFAVSSQTTTLFRLDHEVIDKMMKSNSILNQAVQLYQDHLDTTGVPQVDYLIYNDKKQFDTEGLQRVSFKKYRCWLVDDNVGIQKLNESYNKEKKKKLKSN